MRYREFELTEDELFELKMSPGNLARMAKDIDARAGLEFELIVPGVQDEEEEFESEPDYDADERFPIGPGWRRDVVEFFRGGEMGNSTGYIERRIAELDENFYGWFDDEIENYIGGDAGQERALEIATDNVSEDDYDTTEEYQSALLAYIEHNEDKIRTEIEEELRDDADSFWERYLDEEGINSMADFANVYDLEWPYWTQQEYYGGGGTVRIDDIADNFSNAIGRQVNAASGYHSGRREPGKYVVEPDSSLHGDDGESGLEFISPPLTIPEMIEDIDKVAKWASSVGAYTNESTGLHMNVSVPGQANLDYVKLAMFLGDNYILEQFGREGNTYCKSALNKIKQTARANPDRVDEMLRQFQGGLNQLASKLIHTGSTEKYTSINVQSNRVEFRSPGGDWLGEYASDPGKITNTLLRTVVALDVATKPEEYKQEYYKKLYKTLSQGTEDSSIEYFARYAAGELPKAALKSFIRQIQTKRQVSKEKPDSGKLYWWRVSKEGRGAANTAVIEVVADSESEALSKAAREWGLASPEYMPTATADPIRPYEETPQQTPSRDQEFTGTWEVVTRLGNEVVYTFSGIGNEVAVAQRRAENWAEATGFDDPIYVRPVMRPRMVAGSTQDRTSQRGQMPRHEPDDGNWEIYSLSTNNSVYRFVANTEEEAVRAFNIWQDTIRNPNVSRQGFNLRAVQPGEPSQTTYNPQQPVPGSTEYLNRELAAQGTGSLPEGNVRWRILDFDDNEVHSFVHRTVQREANAYAIQWLRQNGMLGRGEFRVVPVQ